MNPKITSCELCAKRLLARYAEGVVTRTRRYTLCHGCYGKFQGIAQKETETCPASMPVWKHFARLQAWLDNEITLAEAERNATGRKYGPAGHVIERGRG